MCVVALGMFYSVTLHGEEMAQNGAEAEGTGPFSLDTSSLLTQPETLSGVDSLEPAQPLPPFEVALARKVPGRLVYGLYCWAGEYHKYRKSIQEIGWPSFRFAGPFDDRIMKAVAEDGGVSMVTLSNRLLEPGRGKDRTHFESDEAMLEAYLTKVDGFITRYGAGGSFFDDHPDTPVVPIVDVELWNEPNFQYLIPPDGRSQTELEAAREALYAKLLTTVYPAIKARHPEANIIAFATGGMSAGDLRFIKHVHALDAGIGECYDVLSTHPYVRPAAPEANSLQPWGSYSIARGLAYIRNVMRKAGSEDKPIWYTEIGWPISHEDGGRYGTPAHKKFVSPDLQAAYVCRTYALALRLGVERVHIMFASDTDGFNGGFFLKDGTWRPSATAVQTMIQMMPNPKLIEALSDGEGGLYAYRYGADSDHADTPDNEVVMLWHVQGPSTYELAASPSARVLTDMLGQRIEIPAHVSVSIPIGPCPVYVASM